MASRPVVETSEGPGAGPFVSAWWRKDNVSEYNGGQTVSQRQAEALRNRTEKEKASTKRSSHSGRKWEDKSILTYHGTTQGDQKEKDQSSPEGQGHGSFP